MNEVINTIKNEVTQIEEMNQKIESVLIEGNLASLTSNERVKYYSDVCKSLGLNPSTKPFEYIVLNGKLTLYALKSATEQLRKIHKVSVVDLSQSEVNGCLITKVKVVDGSGRCDMATGVVKTEGLRGDALANAIMKSETKAKRRATLSICGLAMLDEAELDTIPDNAKHEFIEEVEAESKVCINDVQVTKLDELIEQCEKLGADDFKTKTLTYLKVNSLDEIEEKDFTRVHKMISNTLTKLTSIDADQLNELSELINQCENLNHGIIDEAVRFDKDKFLEFFKIKTLNTVKKEDFNNIKEALKNKIEKLFQDKGMKNVS